MKRQVRRHLKEYWPLAVSFCIPFFMMLVIYAFQGVYPFGNSSLLTIDLGQQYIDFYADYRKNLLSNPGNFLYSFQKSLGGEMIGLWAYYLASPFHLLFFLFPQDQLSLAVTFLTLFKIGSMGLTFSFYLKKVFPGNNWTMIVFAVVYALMGYTIVYQLNLMWLDGLIFLPLIAYGLEMLLVNKKGWIYSVFLGLTLYANYYIGYMICLFLPFFYVFRMIPIAKSRRWKLRPILQRLGLFGSYSLLAAGLFAFLLLPTLHTLLDSKAGYMDDSFPLEWAYPPQQLLSKFVLGSFNFDQMPSGLPTVFVGTTATISFVCFLLHRSFPVKEKITAFLIVLLLILSMNLEAFNKIWHAMQFPVWFPYRFAFLFSFFVVLNGYRAFSKGIRLTRFHLDIGVIGTIGVCFYLVAHLKTFDYLTLLQIVVAGIIAVLVLLLFFLLSNNRSHSVWQWLLLLLTLSEMGANAVITLSRLGYVSHDQYQYETKSLDYFMDELNQLDDGFHRIEKTFHRSKNDSHQAQYMGVTHFSSTYEQSMPELFKRLGFTAHNGFAVYANGTLLTDALFGIKYYLNEENQLYNQPTTESFQNLRFQHNPLDPPSSFEWDVVQTKPDLMNYPVVHSFEGVQVRRNPFALPVAFTVSEQLQAFDAQAEDPLELQNQLFRSITGTTMGPELMTEETFASIAFENANLSGPSNQRTVRKENLEEKGAVEFTFHPNGIDSYYLTLHPSIKQDDVTMYLNGEKFAQYPTYYEPVVLNIASEGSTSPVVFRIEIELDTKEINVTDMTLYRLNRDILAQSVRELKNGGLNVIETSNGFIEGTVSATNRHSLLLITLPYSEGWHASVNGETVALHEVMDSLMALPLDPGTHEIRLQFTPPWLMEGSILSIISFLLLLWINKGITNKNNVKE